MGQAVRVVEKRRLDKTTIRYEVNRSLTGMAHVGFTSAPNTDLDRPTSVLATRLFETGLVKQVHVFSNLVTVSKTRELGDSETQILDSIVEELFIHYLPGVEPTPIPKEPEAPTPPPEAATE